MSSLEAKREQFRRYLERSGVIDSLSKALIKLYEESNKPEDAIRYVRKYMCESCVDDVQYEALKSDFQEANKTIQQLEHKIDALKSKLKPSTDEVYDTLLEAWQKMQDNDEGQSLLKKYFTADVLQELKGVITKNDVNLYDCAQSGLTHFDSSVGIYAADFESYDDYKLLFDPIIMDYHGQLENQDESLQKPTDWGNVEEILNIDPEKKYIKSTRIRIARNIIGYSFFPKLTEEQFKEIEVKVKTVLETLEDDLAGTYTSVKDIEQEAFNDLVNRHLIFKKGDEFLRTAGCYRFWPSGRGTFFNPGETFLVWVNEEDHLRIISMTKCGDLGDVYNRLIAGLKALEASITFQHHNRYGNITTCPSNLGTTLRASVHIQLPNLAKDPERLQEMANSLQLQIRGTGGEHTAIEDGVMDISNKRRLGFTEFELVKGLQEGILELIKKEEELTE